MSDSFTISRSGMWLVCGDGPELLTYQGDGTPRWKTFCEGLVYRVLIQEEVLYTIDVDGQIQAFRLIDGQPLDGMSVPSQPVAVAGDGHQVLAVSTQSQVHLSTGAVFGFSGVTAMSFGPDANSLGVGDVAGIFRSVDTSTGAAWGELDLQSGPIRGVAWSGRGVWLVTAGTTLFIVSGDGGVIAHQIASDAPLGAVCCTADGAVATCVQGDHRVWLADLHQYKPAGTITLRRTISGIGLTDGDQLGIGLDDGDANVIDLFSGAASRTEPHPGRGRNVWNLENRVDTAQIRGAKASIMAGDAPIANWVRPPGAEEESGGCSWGCIVAVIVFMLCTGCLGSLLLLWGLGYL